MIWFEDISALVTSGGNRYSIDGSYDLSWNHKFPADGSTLWPEGKLLQLQRLAFSSHFREKRHIIFLLPNKLVIAEQTDPDIDLPRGILDDGSGYRFYSGTARNEQEYDASDIAKVELGLTAATMGIAIWAKNERGTAKRVFKAHSVGMPQVIEDLADESVKQGIGCPPPGLIKMKQVNVYRTQLLYRVIERQFKRCSPHAEIELAGEQMPEEVFRRIVK